MARMYPVQPHFHSPGEKMLFERLQQELPPQVVVIHGLYWRRDDGQTEEETDFVIIHPDYGFLVCEVKSGYNMEFQDGQVLLHGRMMEPNPYHQARQGRRLLSAFLRDIVAGIVPAPHFAIARAVWLTGRVRGTLALPPAYDALTLTQDDAREGQVAAAIERHFARLAHPTPMTPAYIEGIIDELWPVQSARLTVARLLAGERRHFRRLHPDQVAVIEALLARTRGDVIGGAGTGKTVVAYEIAARLADQGLRVLYLCTHRNQVHWLQGDMHHHPAFFLRQPHFAIVDIEDLLRRIIAAGRGVAPAQVGLPRYPHARATALRDSIALISERAVKNEHVPDLFTMPASSAAPFFDAVVLDEAQDVAPELRAALESLLADPTTGHYYTFGDERQNEAYAQTHPISAPLELKCNLRNAREIYELMQRIHPDLPTPATLSPDHPQGHLEYRIVHMPSGAHEAVRIDAEKKVLTTLLHDLIFRENVRPEQIMIISCRTQEMSKVTGKRSIIFHTRDYHIDGVTLRQLNWRIVAGCVPITTIQSAKGLESDIVILVETDGLADGNVPQARVYIAASRARSRLYILSRKRAFERVAFLPRPPKPKRPPRKRKRT